MGTRAAYPRASASSATGSLAGSDPSGPATVRFGGSRCTAYHRSTTSRASGTGSPGLPEVTTEFARWVNPLEARRTQSPNRSLCIGGQAPTMTRWRSSTESARWGAPRRAGAGGMTLAAVTRDLGTRTSPLRVATTRNSPSASTSCPTTSVRVAPETGSRASSRCRTTTLDPTRRSASGPGFEASMARIVCPP